MDWSDVVGIIGGLAGLASAYFSFREWQKTNRKIAMLNNATRAAEILPAWYTTRMMSDYWLFGLLTTSDRVIAITQISAVSDNGEWMDVRLATIDEIGSLPTAFGNVVHAVANDRTTASLRISNIVAAIELQSS